MCKRPQWLQIHVDHSLPFGNTSHGRETKGILELFSRLDISRIVGISDDIYFISNETSAVSKHFSSISLVCIG